MKAITTMTSALKTFFRQLLCKHEYSKDNGNTFGVRQHCTKNCGKTLGRAE